MAADREEKFLTVAEVADWLKLNQQTVRNWIDQGSLPAVRVGRRVRIKQSDLDRILEAGYRGGGPPAPAAQGPSAEDFWSGEPVGVADPDPSAVTPPSTETGPAATANGDSHPSVTGSTGSPAVTGSTGSAAGEDSAAADQSSRPEPPPNDP